MYSKKIMAMINCGWLAAAAVGVLLWNSEVSSIKSTLAYANYRIERLSDEIGTLQTDKFTVQMDFEEKLQEQRVKTHEANERHGYTLTQIKDAATAGMTAAQLEGWILRNETPEDRSPKEQLKELVEKLQKLTR
jgi:hypothetical protein